MIPYGKQEISEADLDSVMSVLKSEYLTQGPIVQKFEKAVSDYCGSKYAVATNSATSALHVACLALGVGQGDIVWTSPVSFVASANCALYCGATIDFVDIDSSTFCMSVDALQDKLECAEKSGMLPKVVIPVHLAGHVCDMKSIRLLSLKYGFKIIEDASHAIGAIYDGLKVGSCFYSEVTVFSFHPVKIITTGEGGMALTNSQEVATIMGRLRSHGITRNLNEMERVPDGLWYYEQLDLGFNYRMSDIHAALGLSQLSQLDSFLEKRHKVANKYEEIIPHGLVKKQSQDPLSISSYHLYILRMKDVLKRNSAFERMRNAGILVNVHYIPIYRQPYYSRFCFDISNFPESENYYREAISIPIYPSLTYDQQLYIVETLFAENGFQNLF